MPFTSDKQRKYCWYLYNKDVIRGIQPKWDCHRYAKGGVLSLKERLEKQQSKSLSGEELLDLVDRKANLLTYPELTNYENLNECLKPYGACILLYLTRENYGHWCCIIKHKDKHIEFFDSYGLFPDDEFKFIPEHFRKVSDQVYPHLTYLLYKANCPIEYNNYRLQSKTDNVNKKIATCGRHVGCRLMFRNMSLDDYSQMLLTKDGITPDMKVTLLTSGI